MGFYSKYILPKAIDYACGLKPAMLQRAKIIPLAQGKVLEIGVGTGLNLSFYDKDKISHLTGIDPSLETWQQGHIDPNDLPYDFDFVKAFAENLPLDNNSMDTVVVTYSFCTIPDTQTALQEIRRVLKPQGKLLFCEHGKAPDPATQKWQNLINPIWKRFGGGCNLNRNIPELLELGGFEFSNLESMYLPGWKPASFNYWGTAQIR